MQHDFLFPLKWRLVSLLKQAAMVCTQCLRKVRPEQQRFSYRLVIILSVSFLVCRWEGSQKWSTGRGLCARPGGLETDLLSVARHCSSSLLAPQSWCCSREKCCRSLNLCCFLPPQRLPSWTPWWSPCPGCWARGSRTRQETAPSPPWNPSSTWKKCTSLMWGSPCLTSRKSGALAAVAAAFGWDLLVVFHFQWQSKDFTYQMREYTDMWLHGLRFVFL